MEEEFREEYKSLWERSSNGKIDCLTQGELYGRYKKLGMTAKEMAKIVLEVSNKAEKTKLESGIRHIDLCIKKYKEAVGTKVKENTFRGVDKVGTEEKMEQISDTGVDNCDQEGEGQNEGSSEEMNDDIENSTSEKVDNGNSSVVKLSDTDESAESWEKEFPAAKVMMIPIEKLEAAPVEWNFFQNLSEERFEELKRSIEEYGVQHNLVVQEVDFGKFRILSGHQRVKACKDLFETTKKEEYRSVPCKVYGEGELSDEDARRIVIFTNTAQRGDLSLEDRVKSVKELTELEQTKAFYGSGVDVKKKVSEILGVSRSAVFRLQNLSSLDEKLLALCGNKSEGKKISVREGEVLSKLTAEQQEYICEKKYYEKLTPSRLSALKSLSADATNDDIDKIFDTEKEYRYSVITTVERPDGCETIGIHVKSEEKVKLGEFLARAIEGDDTLSESSKKLLISLAEELTNSSGDPSEENKNDALA